MRSAELNYIILMAALTLLLALPAQSAPDEASGAVIHIVDGDTFDVQDLGRVRLADIDCPEMDTPQGREAKDYAISWLYGRVVYLDIDDLMRTDKYGRLVCVVYLPQSDGSPDIQANFNRMMVDSGHACLRDFTDNEFSPERWWDGAQTIAAPAASSTGTETARVYVGSVRSDKFHYPDCRWAEKISPENEIWFSSAQDALNHGYQPCKVCNPG